MGLHLVLDGLTVEQLVQYKDDLKYYEKMIDKKLGVEKSYRCTDDTKWYDPQEMILDMRKDGLISAETERILDDLYLDAMLGKEVLEKVKRTLKGWKKLNRVPFKEVKELLGEIEFQGF